MNKLMKFQGSMSTSDFGNMVENLTGQEFNIIKFPIRGYNYNLVKIGEEFELNVKSNQYMRLFDAPVLYFTKSGEAYQSAVTVFNYKHYAGHDETNCFHMKKWSKVSKLVNVSRNNVLIINTESEIDEILKRTNPFAYEYAKENDLPAAAFIIAPELELLHKAGYAFVERLFRVMERQYSYEPIINMYNRLVNNNGKNIKQIFKTDKCVYSLLKEEEDLSVWDNYRRMYKKGRLTAQDIGDFYNKAYSEREVKLFDEVLRKGNGEKTYFSLKTLLRYLDKIDMYEAIDFYEGMELLRDYLSMCNQLEIKPNLTSDSLKREHDVTARIFRTKKNDILDKKMQEPCHKASKYNYKEETFFIRSIEGYDDLVDEAKQQRNCVASYGNSIANGHTMVFVMRQNKHPDKSIATIELDNTGEIRQAKLACNRPVTSKAQNDFLKRWRKHVLDIMHGNVYKEEEGQFALSVC